MTICILLLAALCLYGIRFAGTGYFEDYLGREQTSAIKGIFVVLVFLRHFEQYVTLKGNFEKIFQLINTYSGQLIVAMFLFYSGYGIICSVNRKGKPYVDGWPKDKVLRLLIRFDVAVLAYLLLRFFLGKTYSPFKILLILLGWESIGNSNWYIFAILWCYLLTWVAYQLHYKIKLDPLAITAGLLLIYCIILLLCKEDAPRFYNTVFCYVAGLYYGQYRKTIEGFLQASSLHYYGSLLAELLVMGALSLLFLKTNVMGIYVVLAAIFSVFVVQFTMKVCICNQPLMVLGDYVFEVYILQRIPMIGLKGCSLTKGFVKDHTYLYLILCIAITALLSWAYQRIEEKWL